MQKTLRELLKEGIELVPIFSSPFCQDFKIGFWYNGIPHTAFRDRFKTQSEAQGFIDKLMKDFH